MINRAIFRQVWDDLAQGLLIVTQGILGFLRNSLAVIGLLATITVGYVIHNEGARTKLFTVLPFSAPEFTYESEVDSLAEAVREPAFKATNLLGLDETAVVGATENVSTLSEEQELVARFLSKRYRINKGATDIFVAAAWAAGKETSLDPLVILAVTAVESRFNPFAESSMGAQGVMQVMSKVHQDKLADFGGQQAALNPVSNIKVGALVLKDCVKRGGSLEAGLKLYLGAVIADEGSYLERVHNEHERLKLIAKGKANIPITTPVARPQAPAIPKVDEQIDQLAALG